MYAPHKPRGNLSCLLTPDDFNDHEIVQSVKRLTIHICVFLDRYSRQCKLIYSHNCVQLKLFGPTGKYIDTHRDYIVLYCLYAYIVIVRLMGLCSIDIVWTMECKRLVA